MGWKYTLEFAYLCPCHFHLLFGADICMAQGALKAHSTESHTSEADPEILLFGLLLFCCHHGSRLKSRYSVAFLLFFGDLRFLSVVAVVLEIYPGILLFW